MLRFELLYSQRAGVHMCPCTPLEHAASNTRAAKRWLADRPVPYASFRWGRARFALRAQLYRLAHKKRSCKTRHLKAAWCKLKAADVLEFCKTRKGRQNLTVFQDPEDQC